MQSARLYVQSYQVVPPPQPHTHKRVLPTPRWVQGGDTLTYRRRGVGGGAESNSDEGTDSLVLYLYYRIGASLQIDCLDN